MCSISDNNALFLLRTACDSRYWLQRKLRRIVPTICIDIRVPQSDTYTVECLIQSPSFIFCFSVFRLINIITAISVFSVSANIKIRTVYLTSWHNFPSWSLRPLHVKPRCTLQRFFALCSSYQIFVLYVKLLSLLPYNECSFQKWFSLCKL